jgi:hypothetical protein
MPKEQVRSQEWIDKIEALVHRAESLGDPAARAVAVDLLQAVLEFHAAALDRMLEITVDSNEALLDRIAADELVSSMLLLHDLHPDDLETRVHRAVDKLAEMFLSLGAKLSFIAVEPGTLRLQFDSPRSWTGAPVKASVENAVFQAAPEIETVIIEGLKETPPANFVPVSNLLGSNGANGSHV